MAKNDTWNEITERFQPFTKGVDFRQYRDISGTLQEEKYMSVEVPETELRDQLMRDNAEFRRLAEEHQSYDVQLENLNNKHFLSEEEQVQEKTLKKKKLLLKDQMYMMVQKFRKEMEVS